MEKRITKYQLEKLVNKVTRCEQSHNDCFSRYGHEVTLQSGTRDYVDVVIDGHSAFNFDFWTKELDFSGYLGTQEEKIVEEAFKSIYGRVVVTTENQLTMETLEFYKNLDKKNLVKALDKRHKKVCREVKQFAPIEDFKEYSHFREEHEKTTYVYEVAISNPSDMRLDIYKKIARSNNCYWKLIHRKDNADMFVIFTGKFAEYKD